MTRWLNDTRGTTAIEFALVAPMFLAMLMGGLAFGTAVWNRNVLQNVAADAARCFALGGPRCTTIPSWCAAGTATDCYIADRARERGMPTNAIATAVNPSLVINGISYTSVSLTYPFRLLGYQISLSANAVFPNGS